MKPGWLGFGARRSVVAILLAAAVGGCGSETGLLIEVTRDDSVPAAIGRLVVFVGADRIDRASYVDLDPDQEVLLDGRDLADDPYRLLLRPGNRARREIMVAVVAMREGEVVGFGALDRPVAFVDESVAKWRVVLRGELPRGFGISETGCLSWVDDQGNRTDIGGPNDRDCDGFTVQDGDCDDWSADVNPGVSERCGNQVDDDCDDVIDENLDEDGDSVTNCDGDCDDKNPAVYPGSDERCDGIDNNCNGMCDEGHDRDGDRYTPCGSTILGDGESCRMDETKVDCDDADERVHPGATERCNGVDDDCDGACDEDPRLDRDGDLYTECGSIIGLCGRRDETIDCDDRNPAVRPGAAELCNGIDDDCDGKLLSLGLCFALDRQEDRGCFIGVRECAERDEDPGDWKGPCWEIVATNNAAPDSVCLAYDQCDVDDDADPHACAVANSGLEAELCKLHFSVQTGEQCLEREVALPTGGVVDCGWTVVGGTRQGDYRIGLRPLDLPAETPQPNVDACEAVLQVTSEVTGPPSSLSVLLRKDEESRTTYFALILEASPTDSCNPPDGLTCEALPPP